ncbi:hypothetical protein RCL1_006536 [Eukaryota sp. TZLM3-RCL]
MSLPQPKAPELPRSIAERNTGRRLFVVLEYCGLETAKTRNRYQLLNSDDHSTYFRRINRDPSEARPDIVHHCLLSLLDSPLNKAGLLQVFIRTRRGVIIEVNPQLRIPRTFKRFAALMVQLLHKLSIRAADGPDKLLKVIKNPIDQHLPPGAPRILLSYSATDCVNVFDYVRSLPDDSPVVFICGGHAHGKLEIDYHDSELAISEYPLSGGQCLARLTTAFEMKYGIL